LRLYSCTKKLQNQTVTREKLRKTLLCEKVANKMLVELTPDQNFSPIVRQKVYVGANDLICVTGDDRGGDRPVKSGNVVERFCDVVILLSRLPKNDVVDVER
jgi:hypothetical protein